MAIRPTNIFVVCPYNFQLKVILQVLGFPRVLYNKFLREFNVPDISHVTYLRGLRDYP